MVKQYNIHLQGLVQGVGFRPFVYNLAQALTIPGSVRNSNDGVEIVVQAEERQMRHFVKRLREEKPEVVSITDINVSETDCPTPSDTFRILPSEVHSDRITQISPDIAVCEQCLDDIKRQPHRKDYPFVNCTNCGPRFSIIETLPYDRPNTTMARFEMCPHCRAEYEQVENRRFHAQPVACNHCGPFYYIDNPAVNPGYMTLLHKMAETIDNGQVIALKSLGGYNLVCDALNGEAIARLRKVKQRDAKPFAVMFSSVEQAREYVHIDGEELKQLTGWRRPIVLLRQKKNLAEGVNPGMNTLGVMLPYLPVHYQLLECTETEVLVMTSGNISNEPIVMEPSEAEKKFTGKVPLIVHHNRPVFNRVDDSVVFEEKGKTQIIRRSRGYVPEPLFIKKEAEGILAFGAELSNAFALGRGNQLLFSQYIGNLHEAETLQFYEETMSRFIDLFRFTPKLLVCDLHPDYFSSRLAEYYATAMGLPLLRVQHHHAHAAAAMIEHGYDTPAIAWCLDGVGLGTDGNGWGSELLKVNYDTFERITHFENMPLPGGDKASAEPWRMAVAYMHRYGYTVAQYPSDFMENVGSGKITMIEQMIRQNINTPLTSGAGRLFDAVAALLGICRTSAYQAEAAMKLEAICSGDYTSCYPNPEGRLLDFRTMFEGILNDLLKGTDKALIAAKFHNTLCETLFYYGRQAVRNEGTNSIILTGGVFQNRRLSGMLREKFENNGITVHMPEMLPCNDGGIAAGQIAVGISKRNA